MFSVSYTANSKRAALNALTRIPNAQAIPEDCKQMIRLALTRLSDEEMVDKGLGVAAIGHMGDAIDPVTRFQVIVEPFRLDLAADRTDFHEAPLPAEAALAARIRTHNERQAVQAAPPPPPTLRERVDDLAGSISGQGEVDGDQTATDAFKGLADTLALEAAKQDASDGDTRALTGEAVVSGGQPLAAGDDGLKTAPVAQESPLAQEGQPG